MQFIVRNRLHQYDDYDDDDDDDYQCEKGEKIIPRNNESEFFSLPFPLL